MDYLEVSSKSMQCYIGGVLYTNKLGFKKFYPCESEQGEETGQSLHSFVKMVDIPISICSNNHWIFSEGLFKKLFHKFDIFATFTNFHLPCW